MAAPVIRGSYGSIQNAGTTPTSVTVARANYSSAPVAGDSLWVFVLSYSSTAGSTPAGWTQYGGSYATTTGTRVIRAYYKASAAGSGTSDDATFTHSAGVVGVVAICWTGPVVPDGTVTHSASAASTSQVIGGPNGGSTLPGSTDTVLYLLGSRWFSAGPTIGTGTGLTVVNHSEDLLAVGGGDYEANELKVFSIALSSTANPGSKTISSPDAGSADDQDLKMSLAFAPGVVLTAVGSTDIYKWTSNAGLTAVGSTDIYKWTSVAASGPVVTSDTVTEFDCQGTPGDVIHDLDGAGGTPASNWVQSPADGFMGGAWWVVYGPTGTAGTLDNYGEFSTDQVYRGTTSLKFESGSDNWNAQYCVPPATRPDYTTIPGFHQRVFLYMEDTSTDDMIFWWTVNYDGGPTYDFTEIEGTDAELALDRTDHTGQEGRPESYSSGGSYKPATSIPLGQWVRMEVLFDPSATTRGVVQRIYFDPEAAIEDYDLEVVAPDSPLTGAYRVPYSPIFAADRIVDGVAGYPYIDGNTLDTDRLRAPWYISHHAIAPLSHGWIGPLAQTLTLDPIPSGAFVEPVALTLGEQTLTLAPIPSGATVTPITLAPSLRLAPIPSTATVQSLTVALAGNVLMLAPIPPSGAVSAVRLVDPSVVRYGTTTYYRPPGASTRNGGGAA